MNILSADYQQTLPDGLLLQHTQPLHAHQLETLQEIIFPTLVADERIRAVHYLRHIELFPEGQFVITNKTSVVAMTTTMRTGFDLTTPLKPHTFKEIIADGWLTNHDPTGEWLYGLDMGVIPARRGRGLARNLYKVRQTVARQLGLKGQLTVGMMNGYGADQISGEQYYEELRRGRRMDPTLTPQMKIGFEPIELIPEDLHDAKCGNYGVLMRLTADYLI